jgi:hypothetical protein
VEVGESEVIDFVGNADGKSTVIPTALGSESGSGDNEVSGEGSRRQSQRMKMPRRYTEIRHPSFVPTSSPKSASVELTVRTKAGLQVNSFKTQALECGDGGMAEADHGLNWFGIGTGRTHSDPASPRHARS